MLGSLHYLRYVQVEGIGFLAVHARIDNAHARYVLLVVVHLLFGKDTNKLLNCSHVSGVEPVSLLF